MERDHDRGRGSRLRCEEVLRGLEEFAARRRLDAASLQGIGALSRITLGFFEPETRDYRRVEVHPRGGLPLIARDR